MPSLPPPPGIFQPDHSENPVGGCTARGSPRLHPQMSRHGSRRGDGVSTTCPHLRGSGTLSNPAPQQASHSWRKARVIHNRARPRGVQIPLHAEPSYGNPLTTRRNQDTGLWMHNAHCTNSDRQPTRKRFRCSGVHVLNFYFRFYLKGIGGRRCGSLG